ncbi:MAG: hypothetical protein IT381_08275 [Deltaproteobacteria bacterium]|nr:hypothetical protein [Deltaproteobacteria bacterium]
MSEASVRLGRAVDWALSMANADAVCDEPMTPVPHTLSATVAQNVIDVATADGVCEPEERVELARFFRSANMPPAAHRAYQAALALPSESADMARRRRQLDDAARLAELARLPSEEAQVLGGVGATILILDALFGRSR